MTAEDNRLETPTTVGELDALDIGKVISFTVPYMPLDVVGVLQSLVYLPENDTRYPYKLRLTDGQAYDADGDTDVILYERIRYTPSKPVLGFHNW